MRVHAYEFGLEMQTLDLILAWTVLGLPREHRPATLLFGVEHDADGRVLYCAMFVHLFVQQESH